MRKEPIFKPSTGNYHTLMSTPATPAVELANTAAMTLQQAWEISRVGWLPDGNPRRWDSTFGSTAWMTHSLERRAQASPRLPDRRRARPHDDT